MQGQFPCSSDEKLVDNEQSYRCLKFGDIKGETQSTVVAAKNQATGTNYFKNKILKEEAGSKCQLCKQHEEGTTDHLSSGCPILAKNQYLMRYDRVGAHVHYSMCKALGIETTEKWNTHTPKLLCEYEDVTVLWNKECTQTEKIWQIGQI